MSIVFAQSPRSRVHRKRDRATYDVAAVHAILDAGLVAHVSFAVDEQPFVIPMAYARLGESVVLHGAPASRLQKQLASGLRVALAVTVVDGLVLARSAYHHSMNYRSVVVFGTARPVTDEAEKRRALDALVDHAVPGRAARVRPPSSDELRGTHVLLLEVEDASAKVRRGPPIDDAEDLALPVWAGVIPLPTRGGPPIDAEDLPAGARPAPEELEFERS